MFIVDTSLMYNTEAYLLISYSFLGRKQFEDGRDNPQPSRCLGVFGLSIYTTEQQINHIFSKYGPVERVEVVIDAKTGNIKEENVII